MELEVKVSHNIEPKAKNRTKQYYIKSNMIKALKPMPQNQKDLPIT